MTANEIKITASFTFHGTDHKDVEVINPGDWFGKTWLMEIGGSYSSFFVVVEADSVTDAIDELIDSKYGHQFILDEVDYADYGVGTDNPTCYFGGNNGHPCCIDDLLIHGDDRTGYTMAYNVEGWAAPVEPTKLSDVREKLDLRAECESDVKRPGKMEGNASYVPYFWDHYLDGGADDDERGVLRFDVTNEDRLIFPDLNGVDSVYLYEDEQGSVNDLGRPANDDEYFGNEDEA